jgi:hypothetical protein
MQPNRLTLATLSLARAGRVWVIQGKCNGTRVHPFMQLCLRYTSLRSNNRAMSRWDFIERPRRGGLLPIYWAAYVAHYNI